MIAGKDLLSDMAAALAESGLILRGGFDFDAQERPPPGPSGAPARAVVLVGQAGAAAWPHFLHWRSRQPAGLVDPLDSWSRDVIGAVAARFGARAAGPNDRPFLPIQRWAMRAEGLKPSPLGILMHPLYGLWHAYRGVLLFDRALSFPRPPEVVHLCDSCVEKPCLKSCPVDAYHGDGFAYQACLSHVRGPDGGACRTTGCLDRNACPHGAAYRYPADMQAFHMAAFSR
ncbi:MAG: 4Fe-4S dicluster domain-containing protein [Mesorhizobium sp.]